jgi:hypothetical protein
MPIYFLPLGIEAGSKKEAEQKILKLHHIASAYTVDKENKEQTHQQEKMHAEIPTPYKELLTAVGLIGLSWAQTYLDSRKLSPDTDRKSHKYQWARKQRKQKAIQ